MKIALYLVFVTISVSGEKYQETGKYNVLQKNVTTFMSEDLFKWNSPKSVNDRVSVTETPKQHSTLHASVSKTFTSRVHQKETKTVLSQDNIGKLSNLTNNTFPRQVTKIIKASSTTNVYAKTLNLGVSKFNTEYRQPLSTPETSTSKSRENQDSISRKYFRFTTPYTNTFRSIKVISKEIANPEFNRTIPQLFTSPLLSKITSFVQSESVSSTNDTVEQLTNKATSSQSSEEIFTAIPTKSKTSETRSITRTSSHQQNNSGSKYKPTTIDYISDTRTRPPPTLTITSRKKMRTTKEDKKEFTDFASTEAQKQKHDSKHFKPFLTPELSSASSKFYQKTTSEGRISHPYSQQNHVYTTMTTLMPRSESSNTSVVFTKITPTSRIPHILTSRKHFETKSVPSIVTKSPKHTNHHEFLMTSRQQYRGETKILINEIAISQATPNEQFIELKISSDFTHDLRSYKVVVFSGMGEVLSTIDMHGNTGKQYKILANEDIHVNIRKELQEKKSLAVAVYHRSQSVSSDITMHSKGVMDAIVLTAYDGKPSDQLMQNLMNDNASPFHVSSSALKNGGSISRCAENHVRDTQDFMELSRPKATRGFRNMKCPRNKLTPSSNSFDNVKMTLAVVMSCLALFLVIVFFVVMMIKHKQRQIKLMQSSLWLQDDDEEEVVLKMGSVTFEENPENPTFKNDVYLTIKS